MTEPRYPYVHVNVSSEDSDAVSGLLWELGAEGVEERDAGTLDRPTESEVILIASFPTEEEANEAIGYLADRWPARLEFVEGDAWRDEWKRFFKPTRLGERLVIKPSWEPFEAKPDDVVLVVDPGRAFGSGTHQTTRLVLQQLDTEIHGGEQILDVGCGSGILAIGALLLGAKDAICIDIDEDAVAVTLENAELNQVSSRVKASTTAVGDIAGTYPVVLANIEARVLIPLAADIAARVANDGLLMLSGILVGQEDSVLAAYPGFTCVARPIDGEWVALKLKKK